jgi:hypothetical protein
MGVFRALLLVLLVASGACFVVYALTSQPSYRKWGLRLLITALAAGFAFFAVLIVERLAD